MTECPSLQVQVGQNGAVYRWEWDKMSQFRCRWDKMSQCLMIIRKDDGMTTQQKEELMAAVRVVMYGEATQLNEVLSAVATAIGVARGVTVLEVMCQLKGLAQDNISVELARLKGKG